MLGDDWSYCNPGHAGFHERFCKNKFPDAYTITYWSHTWRGPETPAAPAAVLTPGPGPAPASAKVSSSPPKLGIRLWGR